MYLNALFILMYYYVIHYIYIDRYVYINKRATKTIQKWSQLGRVGTLFCSLRGCRFRFPPSSISLAPTPPWEIRPRTIPPPLPTPPLVTFNPPIPASTQRARRCSPIMVLASTKPRHLLPLPFPSLSIFFLQIFSFLNLFKFFLFFPFGIL